jgi:hypothetical protein
MKGQALPLIFFCLATGAAMGCLFLLFRGLAALLGLRKFGTGVLDLLFGCLCGGFVFLCALAVDSGRLRLYQAALQALGGWAVAVSLGPWIDKGAKKLRSSFWRLSGVLRRWMVFLRGLFQKPKRPKGSKGKKTGKKPKKQRKKT